MGRQICFYIIQEDFDELLKVISKNGGKIIYEDGSIVDGKVLENMMDQKFRKKEYEYDSFYIKLDESQIFFNYAEQIKRKYVVDYKSDLIRIRFNMEDLKNGGEIYSRLYVSVKVLVPIKFLKNILKYPERAIYVSPIGIHLFLNFSF